VTVVGHAAAISAGEWIMASGQWVNDRTHGHAKKLVRALGEKVFDIIETTPDRLREARRDYRPWAQ
jgi:exodeoxyribonuclease V alpha subunit